MPQTPLELFLALKLPKIKFAVENTLEKNENSCPLLEKISEYAPDMKHFQMANLCPFTSLNVFAFS